MPDRRGACSDARWSERVVAAAFAVALVTAGCGDDGDGAGTPQSGEREATTTEAATPEVLQILVTNDDGVGAEGIDVLVTALAELEGVETTVVAPAEEQSGTGGRSTAGPVQATPAKTAGGHDATAVAGFPSDAVRVAFDELGLDPHVVVAGVNEGQNLGGVVEVSGTVGAARAAARQGVPALAVSQGLGDPVDFDVAAELAVAWIEEHRDALLAGELPVDVVANLNVPSCDTGEVRGVVEVVTDVTTVEGAFEPADCTSTGDGYTDDITAFLNGFAPLAEVTVEAAAD
ncbi:MAG: 5'/3'-nucleotidase SurE [Acidimicrobiales bacterium]